MRISLLTIAFCLFLFSCNKEDAPDFLKTTGVMTTESRTLDAFDAIDLDDNVNIILHQDSIQMVEVHAGKNLLPKITTEVSNGILKIRNTNKWNFMRSYKYEIDVHIHTPNLKKIAYEGGGDIKSANQLNFSSLEIISEGGGSDILLDLNCDTLKAIIHTGVSNLYLTGNSNQTYLYSNGLSIFHAESLVSNDVHVNNASTGDFYVHALNTLLVEVRSFSTTWYKGNPVKTIYSIGTGQVLAMP